MHVCICVFVYNIYNSYTKVFAVFYGHNVCYSGVSQDLLVTELLQLVDTYQGHKITGSSLSTLTTLQDVTCTLV